MNSEFKTKLHGNESFEIIPKWPKGKKFLQLMSHKIFNPVSPHGQTLLGAESQTCTGAQFLSPVCLASEL